MQTSRFQLGLIASLAVGLGFALSSPQAVGYPAGAVVSTGSNPIRSVAGNLDLGGATTVSAVFVAPAEHDLIISDVMLGLTQTSDYCRANGKVVLQDDAGTTYGEFVVSTPHINNAQLQPTTLRAQSGIHVPAGTTIDLQWTWAYAYCGTSTYDLVYTMAGYLSEP
jgi:hypothetical protein